MRWIPRSLFTMALAAGLLVPFTAPADDGFMTVASTTSTENSGLFEHLLPVFTEATGIEVRVVAVGTGQAIRLARNGDADVLLVHHEPSEREFVANGFGVKRYNVMYNDFVIIGPAADPAAIAGMDDAPAAFNAIAESRSAFVSRGDDSGTHKKELELWRAVGLEPGSFGERWYRETGSGMGRTLNVASSMSAYVMSDRATWLNFGNKGDLEVLVEGDPRLFNQYGVILVNPDHHPHVKAERGRAFVEWLIGEQGQSTIAEYRIKGQQAFFPNAGD